VIAGLVLAVLVGSDESDAVRVALPAVMRVTLNVCVPPLKPAPVGGMALVSLKLIPTVSLTVFTRFQLASTAFTVTLNAVPEVRAVGAPVLPLVVPGAAVSPGASSCNLANAPALT